LAASGIRLRSLDLFGPIRQRVRIAQRAGQDTPADKLYAAFSALRAGAHGLVELNTRPRRAAALPAAFGRRGGAEQSVVQETLEACTAENVRRGERAVAAISRRHGRGDRHDYAAGGQILDAELSGLPCGPKAACATKGAFAKQRNRRGRQLGRVVASRYDALVVARLVAGTPQLHAASRPLVLAAEAPLARDEARRQRAVLRVDAGGGRVDAVNGARQRGSRVHGKDCAAPRATRLAASVAAWADDPRTPGRQGGRGTAPAPPSVRPARRVAVRCPKKAGGGGGGVLLSALEPAEGLLLAGQPLDRRDAPAAVRLAYVYSYDQRGGACEPATKGGKRGLGLTKRNKKRVEAQAVPVLLGALAHHVLSGARRWLAPRCPHLARFGLLRLVRDAGPSSGLLTSAATGALVPVALNSTAPLAHGLATALGILLADDGVVVILGET
jgi:hypothetical protein